MATKLRTVEQELQAMDAETIPHETLSSAMAAAFAEIEAATKSANNPHFKSKYADLGAVIDAVKPALIRHGLFFTQRCHPAETGVSVETVLHHEKGDKESLGILFVPADRGNAQGFGSALTYARRYGLMTAFGVPAEDDDGHAASIRPNSQPAVPAEPPKMISAELRDEVQALIPKAGKTVEGICGAYKIGALIELTEAQAIKLRDRLKADAKEPANA